MRYLIYHGTAIAVKNGKYISMVIYGEITQVNSRDNKSLYHGTCLRHSSD